MNCQGEKCKETKTKPYKIVTGKRGKPPVRHFCTACAEKVNCVPIGASVSDVTRNNSEAKPKPPKASTIKVPDGFNVAAAFYLRYNNFENLFEQADRYEWEFRCKGCGTIVTRTKRKDHFDDHKANSSYANKNVVIATEESIVDEVED